MNITASAAAATVLAALLAASGFAYLDSRNELERTKDRFATVQTERDDLTEQVESLKQQVQELDHQVSSSDSSISDLQGQLGEREEAVAAFEGQIDTLSICLEGVVEGMSQVSNGDEVGALLTFSSVSATCEQAGQIIEQRNAGSDGSGSGQEPSLTTRYF